MKPSVTDKIQDKFRHEFENLQCRIVLNKCATCVDRHPDGVRELEGEHNGCFPAIFARVSPIFTCFLGVYSLKLGCGLSEWAGDSFIKQHLFSIIQYIRIQFSDLWRIRSQISELVPGSMALPGLEQLKYQPQNNQVFFRISASVTDKQLKEALFTAINLSAKLLKMHDCCTYSWHANIRNV